MLPEISQIRGVPPGAVLRRELKKRGLDSEQFALSLGEEPATINAINNGQQKINPMLSTILGEKLGVNADYFMLLQEAYYEEDKKKQEILKNQAKPNMKIIQKILFWDTDIDKIDWQKYKRGVIHRVFERGNDAEIREIISFYGEKTVSEILFTVPQHLPSLAENAKKYLGIDIILNYNEK